jgi:O-succinylbenzoate synthase
VKIDRIEIYQIAIPLIYPWRTAYGDDYQIHSVLVKIISGEDYSWGETTPLKAPCYSPEWAGGVFYLSKDFLAPKIIGKDIESPNHLLYYFKDFKGNMFAKAGIESALWVLNAKITKKPLHKLIGGKKSRVTVGADIGIQDNIDVLLRKIQKAIDDGYPRIKLKIYRGWDMDVLRSVRDSFPNYTFHIDCNASYSIKDLDYLKQFDHFDLAMIEQPLHYTDLLDHARLQKEIETPICLDESIVFPRDAEQAIELGSCQYINIKVGRVGGLSNAIRIHDICKESGIPCWVGSMLESAIGQGISIELATLPNFVYPADIFPSGIHHSENIANKDIILCAPGKIAVSKESGIPYEPKESILKHYTIQRAIIET